MWYRGGEKKLLSLFNPNPVMRNSNVRNGRKMRTIQLGQHVYAPSNFWESSRKAESGVQLQQQQRAGSLVHLHTEMWLCMFSCAGFWSEGAASFRMKWTKGAPLLLTGNICTDDHVSWLWKKYGYSAFLSQFNSCCGGRKHLKEHLDHDRTLNFPTKNQKNEMRFDLVAVW